VGLLDIINGMKNGPRGRPQPGAPSSGGMSPITMALIGLLAYKAAKHFGANQQRSQTNPGQAAPTSGPRPGGLFGDLLGGAGANTGAGTGAGAGNLAQMLPGGLGGLLAGAGAGGLLTGGLGRLEQDFQNSGQGGTMQSWIGKGPNEQIDPKDLESALGGETLDTLSKHTGMSRDDLLNQLSQSLPELVDHLTPNGRLPTQEEAARMA